MTKKRSSRSRGRSFKKRRQKNEASRKGQETWHEGCRSIKGRSLKKHGDGGRSFKSMKTVQQVTRTKDATQGFKSSDEGLKEKLSSKKHATRTKEEVTSSKKHRRQGLGDEGRASGKASRAGRRRTTGKNETTG